MWLKRPTDIVLVTLLVERSRQPARILPAIKCAMKKVQDSDLDARLMSYLAAVGGAAGASEGAGCVK
ncbi:hypothetical protein SG09_56470 [Bradyrhizobium ottawaense]|uniref:hypothetical protein n=1 Tax=Bradyrhizobium TaxID=374 RepID=UPI001260ED5F|nr:MULTISPECIES: hypothetical protein [Bradyrhizobium]BBO06297.1 hypothetical protein SG09_56470 [Bradyrhizobium ottawaense]BBO12562.1 hypothetical protein TM102_40320 [Bradyrhizobium sp. TM102]